MNTLHGFEATILRTLEEEGEMRPPQGRLVQEWFWQAASRLQRQGRCVADQREGVVRMPPGLKEPDPERPMLCERCQRRPKEALGPLCDRCLRAEGLKREPDSIDASRYAFEPMPKEAFYAQLMQQPAPDPTFYRADGLSKGRACERCGAAWVDHIAPGSRCPAREAPFPATDLPARLRLLLRRWRAQEEVRGGAEGSVFGQCANDLEESMEECGVPV